jgi:hypothetical protein
MVTGEKNVGVAEGRFCRGFCEKCGAERGFLMVRLWWIAGETWCENTTFLRSEIMPRFSDLFLLTW